MADERKLVVEFTLKNPESSNDSGMSEGVGQTALNAQGENEVNKKKKKNTTVVIGTYLFNQALNSVKQDANLALTRYFNLSENYLAQTDYQNVMTSISKVSSFASTVGVGLSLGGPVGAAIGIGAWGVNEFISYQSRMSGYYSNLNATNFGTAWGQERAGLYDGGKGTEN